MRTDYKIGIAALVLVGLVIVVWSFVDPDPPPAGPPPDEQPAPVVNDDPVDPPGFYRQRRDDDVAVRDGGEAVIGRDRTGGTGDESTDDPGDPPARDASSVMAALQDAIRRSGERRHETSPTPGSNIAGLFGRSTDTTTDSSDTDALRAPDFSAAITPATPLAYTVKDGDSGFWTVSKNVYGDGKYWGLIAKANPDADSNRLRAGQILKVPPLPAKTDRAPGEGPTHAGQVLAEADGKRYYYVQEGDAGFWTVSAKAYGSGKHWALIAKANPNADSDRLNKGQKLLVPALPLPMAASSGTTTSTTVARTLGPGEKWYTVVDGDAGFWDVSKKSYGSGKYYAIIAKANPNVNSGLLRKGQKILVPPLPPSATRVRTTRRPSVATARDRYGAVPIFD